MRKRIQYSQNFIQNPGLIKELVNKSSVGNNDTVYEIGAGSGTITAELIKHARKVVAFELDKNLFNKLLERFGNTKSLEIRLGNFLDSPLPHFPYKVFSNIPFNITSSVIKYLTLNQNAPLDAYLIVQKEAAAKFAGYPIDSKNSQISALLHPWFSFSIAHEFRANDFFPRPNVNAILLQIKKRDVLLISTKHKKTYQDFVTFAFNQFKPNISEGLAKVLGKDYISRLVSPNLKPSQIDLIDWIALFKLFLTKPTTAQKIVKGSFRKQLKQEKNLDKIHRTRLDPTWKS